MACLLAGARAESNNNPKKNIRNLKNTSQSFFFFFLFSLVCLKNLVELAPDEWQEHAQENSGRRLPQTLAELIRDMFQLASVPALAAWGLRDWARPPVSGAVHLWRPGEKAQLEN